MQQHVAALGAGRVLRLSTAWVIVAWLILSSTVGALPWTRLSVWWWRGGDADYENKNATRPDNATMLVRSGDNDDSPKESSATPSSGNTLSRMTESIGNKMTQKKLEFLDRIALVSGSLLRREEQATAVQQQQHPKEFNPDAATPQSDLTLPGRHIHIVTTAALPWFTGTAVNPLLRSAYLHRRTQEINKKTAEDGTVVNGETNNRRWVTLVIPWLELPEDQRELYGKVFQTEQEQEDYIRTWLREEAGMPDAACAETGLQILFYPARYHTGLRSIFAMGDIMDIIMDPATMDVCVLEEPEHCNWFRAPGDGWTKRFNYVVGVVHTNYKEYASSSYHGLWTAPAIAMMSSAMVRAYCHKVIKLSAVLQTYAPEKEAISNVHGVRADFLEEGMRRGNATKVQADESSIEEQEESEPQVYFIGKLLWAKGLDIMLELEDYYKQCTGQYFAIDIYGSGPEQNQIRRAFHGRRKINMDESRDPSTSTIDRDILETTIALGGGTSSPSDSDFGGRGLGKDLNGSADDSDDDSEAEEADLLPSFENLHKKAKGHLKKIKQTLNSVEIPKTFAELRRQPIPATFPGRVDHATVKEHKIFVNPSVSEVLCTTTAEALAMGKFAIVPVHPSNAFFLKFPNCLAYRNKFEFVANLRWALTHEPTPLTVELARQFTWEAATDRFVQASTITWREALERERLGLSKLDERIAWFHNEIGKGVTGDMLRKICGAGPASHQVKYQMQKEEGILVEDDEREDEDDGLSRKFRQSSFAEAIRATVGDLSSFIE